MVVAITILLKLLFRIPNLFIAAIAYPLRNWANKRNWFLQTFIWWFLTTNTYGDKYWRPKLKDGFWRAYLWMQRNPMQNYYTRNYVDGKDTNFKGKVEYKFRGAFGMWRTVFYKGDDLIHGTDIDFKNSPIGKQNITFDRVDKDGNIQKCFRKSRCIPRKIGNKIVFLKTRVGHEDGLVQEAFSLHIRKCNKDWDEYKKEQWKTEIK